MSNNRLCKMIVWSGQMCYHHKGLVNQLKLNIDNHFTLLVIQTHILVKASEEKEPKWIMREGQAANQEKLC